jgi:hypothetical protein
MFINGHNEQEIVNMLQPYNVISFIFGHYVLRNQEGPSHLTFYKARFEKRYSFAVTVFNFVKINVDALKLVFGKRVAMLLIKPVRKAFYF